MNRMVQLPVHFAIDDAMYFSANWAGSKTTSQRLLDPDEVFEMWWSAFWHQYKVGGYLNFMLHPFVSGRASRVDMLERLIVEMKKLPGVWFPTCEELARHCLSRHPA
jgi:peptidoglycan-N-acetylglucosamine deacetylase